MKQKLLFSVLVLLTACEYDNTGLRSNPIDSKIRIETREVLGTESRSLTFHCKTEKSYECFNYPIATEKTEDENSFKITFTGVGEIWICLTALGPASAVVDLNTVGNGDYQIEFNNANFKNKGTLRVTDSEIELIFAQQNGIEIRRSVTKRVPPKTYWGTIGYHDSASADRVNEFLDKLKDRGAVFSKQEPGHYFYYEIDRNGDIVANAKNSGHHFLKAFVFRYYGDEAGFNEQLKALALPYYGDMSIYIETYKGQSINNWTQ